MKPPHLPAPWLVLALLLALWPVLNWYVAGTLDGSNDLWGLLALATVLLLCLEPAPPERPQLNWPLALPAFFLIAYLVASMAGAFIALRAALGFLALAALLSSWRFGRRIHLPLFALCLLALPLAASLQFYLGYPLRVVAGNLSVALLQMNGLNVVREGTLLNWGGQVISIDVPCSGVKMLWAGMYLTYTLAAWRGLSAWSTVAAIGWALCVVVLGNAVRAAALFYTEAGILPLPAWTHAGIGMMVFAAVAGAIVWGAHNINNKISRRQQHA
jgi:exosortase